MNNQEYEQKKRECWEEFLHSVKGITTAYEEDIAKKAINFAFDRIYALGREKETITLEEIEKEAREAVRKEYLCESCAWKNDCDLCGGENTAFDCCECPADSFEDGFKAGANFALGKQEKDGHRYSVKFESGYEVEGFSGDDMELNDRTSVDEYHKLHTGVNKA